MSVTLQDVDELGAGLIGQETDEGRGVFGIGWIPPDEAQELVEGGSSGDRNRMRQAQYPEAEDEANGWEIVSPVPEQRSRSSSFNEPAQQGDKVLCRPGEIPEDLVMGCLDPECDSLFGPDCERRRCGSCRFSFCSHHLRGPWFLGSFGGVESTASVGAAGLTSAPSGASHLPDSLGLPCSGLVYLCRECHNDLPFPLQGVAAGSSASPCAAGNATAKTGPRTLPPGDAALLAGEAQALRDLSFSELSKNDDEDSSRASARALTLRLLGLLRDCLRPWTESERDWVWHLAEELAEADPHWIAQLARQTRWDAANEAKIIEQLVEKSHRRHRLQGREALQVLGVLGRRADVAAGALSERRLGLLATYAAEAIERDVGQAELACCLELLLDAAHELGFAGATGGRRAVVGVLLRGSQKDASLRGELFWALEARVKATAAARRSAAPGNANAHSTEAWASIALEELLRDAPSEVELGLLRQRTWVRHLEHGEIECCRVEQWGENRTFPLAAWPPGRSCLGLEGLPRETESKSAPVIVRCRYSDDSAKVVRGADGSNMSRTASTSSSSSSAAVKPSSRHRDPQRKASGLLLKKDVGMHREQQVGQTLRLLEILIWEDEGLRSLLEVEGRGLTLEDVRATYVIAMTGPGTAMLEFIEGARTLREVRSWRQVTSGPRLPFSPGQRGTLQTFLSQHNAKEDLPKALARLAFTAAISAVLSFVAGLGDRHHENFMVTVDGRLVHVDYGYALGREPLDSVLIHYAMQGGRPATTLQYEELQEALGGDRLAKIFWPVVRGAYLRVRQHPGLLAEMFHTALTREPRRIYFGGNSVAVQRAWSASQAFVARNCVTAMSEHYASRFIHSLLVHCTRNERGTHVRDGLKNFRLKDKTSHAVSKALHAAVSTGRSATSTTRVAAGFAADVVSAGPTFHEVTSVAKDMATGLFSGVRDLIFETSLADDGNS